MGIYAEVYYRREARIGELRKKLSDKNLKPKLKKKEREELQFELNTLEREHTAAYPPGEGPSTNYGRGWNILSDYY